MQIPEGFSDRIHRTNRIQIGKNNCDLDTCRKIVVVAVILVAIEATLRYVGLLILSQVFRSSHFWFLVTFGQKVKKIQKYYVVFVYILQGKMGKTGKKTRKKITQLK